MGIKLWKNDSGEDGAEFFTSHRNRENDSHYSDEDQYIDDACEEVSMSTINDTELRQRFDHAKLNTTMTTIQETRPTRLNHDLFPLERIIESEK